MKKLLFLFFVTAFTAAFGQETKQQLQTRFNLIRNESQAKGITKGAVADAYQKLSDATVSVYYTVANADDENEYSASILGIDNYGSRWFVIVFGSDNTDAATFKLNDLNEIDIELDGEPLTGGEIKNNTLYLAHYDGAALQLMATKSEKFTSDVTFVLGNGKTFGKYSNGQTAAWTGLSAVQAMQDAAIEYIHPAFNSFSISGQATTVEVGTTLSGSKTFTWSIAANSGVVNTIDIYDVTAGSALVAGTSNDGTQAQTVTTFQLNSNGATYSWRGVANNSSPTGTVNSSNFTVTSRFYRFYGAASSLPTNSSEVRALSSNAFHTGATTYNLNTGTSLTRFIVALPPSVTIASVIDLDALEANITSEYVLTGTVSVNDAGGTSRTYNLYQMQVGTPYTSSHRHQITTAN